MRGYRLLEGGGLRLEAEDSIATIANLKDDAYVHCAQPEGTLKIFEDLGAFNFGVFDYDDLRVLIFDDFRVVELTLKSIILLT